MTPKQFERYLQRDGGCLHCGATEGVVPHHRGNRGMGGSKARDVPANIIVMCSRFNGLMESDPAAAETARLMGWKISTHDNPELIPVLNGISGEWVMLDNSFNCWEAT
ncbi:MAG TPA: hypothetical protein VK149_04225 [Sideroxyarcus sp.]|nr:hypothetical protein [Sideroxyarcus sp.]